MRDGPHRILIADDSEEDRMLLASYIASLGYETRFAGDGLEALACVTSFRPDLILLDILLPRLSGLEVCRQLKSQPATSKIMILVVTALNELSDVERAVAAGTDDFLSKPVNKVELVKRVENMLKIKDLSDERDP